ncbi:MAG TPA: erythromycin esterase family protein [Chloroflexota bacterium]|nr:erythromycin esterase family protein [Chloroflexota bacterium]
METIQTIRDRLAGRGAATAASLADRFRALAHPLRGPADLDPLLERIGDARFVLLGEASHGTAEYYNWRRRISQRLIREKGFSFIAVEGDWPDCYRVNRYVKHAPDAGASAREVLHAFARWPTWMWANTEVVELAEWLRQLNAALPADQRVGFYGLDVYSLWESLDAVTRYLERVDPSALPAARRAFRCFEPYAEDVEAYARATALVPTSCQDEVVAMLLELRRKAPQYQAEGREAYFNAEQNALVTRNAERYYRAMIRGGPESWNVRDHHMVETLERLMQLHGPDAKAIVWEHNTHVGDARATDMLRAGMVNVGQLVRERDWRDGVVLVGFGSHHGSVIAGDEWGAPMQRMRVPPAQADSHEAVLHDALGGQNALFLLDGAAAADRLPAPGSGATAEADPLLAPRGHRAIGVVYNPAFERFGNYVPTVLPLRYDAFLYLDETHALHPLHLQPQPEGEPPETYPSGV